MSAEEADAGEAKAAEVAESNADGGGPAPRRKKRKGPPLPRTEAELDSPRLQTLAMLAVVCVSVVVMWGAARAACNYHPPKETRRPRTVPLTELLATPKAAAVEVLQAWETHDYARALEASRAQASEALLEAQEACKARAAACEQERKAAAAQVLTTAELLEQQGGSAWARVTTHRGTAESRSLVRLVQDGQVWYVAQRAPDAQNPPASAEAGAAGAPAAP
jgi:hypothetical protein